MKDGDDMIMIGCTHGQVSAVESVTFAPGSAINWTPTITAMGEDGVPAYHERMRNNVILRGEGIAISCSPFCDTEEMNERIYAQKKENLIFKLNIGEKAT